MDLKQTYNKIAEDYHKNHADDQHWIKSAEKFINLLKPGAKILDVGCGTGLKSKYFLAEGFQITGVDISDKMIEIAKKENPDGTFQVMDMKDVGDLPDIYDGVFAHAVLLHIPKKEISNIIEKLVSKLRAKGYIYIAVKEKSDKDEEIVKENDYGYEYERFFSYYTIEELKEYLKKAGMGIVYTNRQSLPRYNWIQIIGRKND